MCSEDIDLVWQGCKRANECLKGLKERMGYIPGNNDARQWTEECLQIATNQIQISF